jgi:hypothetical protein
VVLKDQVAGYSAVTSNLAMTDSSSTFLNENASSLMPNDSSSDSHSSFNTMEDVKSSNIRDRGTKRKSEAVSDDGLLPTDSSAISGGTNSGTGTNTPKAQAKGGANRASKRRK